MSVSSDLTTRQCREHKSHKHTRDGKKKKENKTKELELELELELESHKHTRDGKKKKENKTKELELELELANKSLYMCVLEHRMESVAYVVRTVKLSDLLSSSSPVPLRQVAYEAGSHLPGSVGCGVWGSQIVFTGGVKPCRPHGLGTISDDSVCHTNVYALETNANTNSSHSIRKLDANLQGAKYDALTVELGGKLYALSYRRVGDPPSFEVLDPKLGRWEGLPQPPFFQIDSPYYDHGNFAYAIAGTKIFASHQECPVFCFDVAHPDREWRIVSTMCGGGPFPFYNRALVLDLQGDDDRKIMFAYSYEPWRLRVYLMSLSENQETITKIGDVRMPRLPEELGLPQRCQLLHIGGQKACLVVTEISPPDADEPDYELGTHKTHGAVIPFQYELDMTKVDKDKKNCLALQFMPLRSFEYHTNPSTLPDPESVGCFLLG